MTRWVVGRESSGAWDPERKCLDGQDASWGTLATKRSKQREADPGLADWPQGMRRENEDRFNVRLTESSLAMGPGTTGVDPETQGHLHWTVSKAHPALRVDGRLGCSESCRHSWKNLGRELTQRGHSSYPPQTHALSPTHPREAPLTFSSWLSSQPLSPVGRCSQTDFPTAR